MQQAMIKTTQSLFPRSDFLVLEEESAALIHHLPAGLASGSVLASTSGLGCWLVEANSTSIIERLHSKESNEQRNTIRHYIAHWGSIRPSLKPNPDHPYKQFCDSKNI